MSAPLAPLDAGMTSGIRACIDNLVALAAANQIGDRTTAAKAFAALQETVAGLALSTALPRPRLRRRERPARLGHARQGGRRP